MPPTKEMQKQYVIVIPMEPSQLTEEMLETYLIPLKSAQAELNQYIQRMEKIIKSRS